MARVSIWFISIRLARRNFFNVRDGFLALAQFQALICWLLACLQSGWKNWSQRLVLLLFSVCSFIAFYNAWLTAGRGLLLSLGLSLLLLASFAYRRGDLLLGQLTLASFLAGGLAWLTNHGLRLVLASESVSGLAGDAALIERADGGRFKIWRTWLNSGLRSLRSGGMALVTCRNLVPTGTTRLIIF